MEKRLSELIEYREKALTAIKRALHPELRPIMSGDDNAVERLAEKIASLESYQSVMVSANKIIKKAIRKNGEVDGEALRGIWKGFTDEKIAELIRPDFMGRTGFPDYATKNNNANIRRLKERLTALTEAKSQEATLMEGQNATLEDCPAENRIRITFPGKPPVEVRSKLKKGGFRWTPSLGVWQAYRNTNTLRLAADIAGVKA